MWKPSRVASEFLHVLGITICKARGLVWNVCLQDKHVLFYFNCIFFFLKQLWRGWWIFGWGGEDKAPRVTLWQSHQSFSSWETHFGATTEGQCSWLFRASYQPVSRALHPTILPTPVSHSANLLLHRACDRSRTGHMAFAFLLSLVFGVPKV